MKKANLNFLVLIVVFLFVTACGRIDHLDDEYFGGESVALTSYQINGNEISRVKDFDVSKKYLADQQNVDVHHKMWSYYTKLIPSANRIHIKEFVIFNGLGNLAGYVEPIDENDLSKWRMGLAIDAIGNLDIVDIKEEFAYISIHEFAHVLTLNSEQINPGSTEADCLSFHTGEGCSNPDSYINAFFELGWKDIWQEFLKLRERDQYDFYLKYQDRFVTDYAASNPGEDIAEIFTFFVTQDKIPQGNTIADQKIQLMYNYPELVELREQIRKDPVLRTMQPGSWNSKKLKKFHKGKIHQH